MVEVEAVELFGQTVVLDVAVEAAQFVAGRRRRRRRRRPAERRRRGRLQRFACRFGRFDETVRVKLVRAVEWWRGLPTRPRRRFACTFNSHRQFKILQTGSILQTTTSRPGYCNVTTTIHRLLISRFWLVETNCLSEGYLNIGS